MTLSLGHLFAGSDEEFFLRGNKYYAQHDYDNALQSYEMINKKGRAVLYNMGNCFYHKNEYAQALVYWSRAEWGATSYECSVIARNKEHVLKKMNKDVDQSLSQRIKNIFNGFIPYSSLLFLQLFFLLCWCLLVLLMRSKRNVFTRVSRTLSACCVIGVAVMLGIYYASSDTHSAIVIKKEGLLFSGPDTGLQVLSPIAYAHEVTVKESREGWHKIRYADMIGWVEADVIQII